MSLRRCLLALSLLGTMIVPSVFSVHAVMASSEPTMKLSGGVLGLFTTAMGQSKTGVIMAVGLHFGAKGLPIGSGLAISHNNGLSWTLKTADAATTSPGVTTWSDHSRLPAGFVGAVIFADTIHPHT